MRPYLLSSLAGFFLLAAVIAVVEGVVRSAPVTAYLAERPADLVTEAGYNARLAALSRMEGERIVVLGDSVGLGQVMANYGLADWQDGELSRALAAERPGATISNLSANGLKAADYARTVEDVVALEVDAIVLVLSARAFSSDFDAYDEQHAHDWRREGFAAPLLQARGAADIVLTDFTGGPLPAVLTGVRARSQPVPETGTVDPVSALLFRQRLASAEFDPSEGFQARRLAEALQAAEAAGVALVLVYATENPDLRDQILPSALRERNFAAMLAFAEQAAPNAPFLGPDPDMSGEHYVDQMHPTPDGYRIMARRIAPVLEQELVAR
ncbi:hypothetical protein [Hyphobacterium sp.]|uniref:hypothetical protein n=1 Tax=Hyphobacterium sp. TaxID=2004662 RepID=UPI003BAD5C69